MKKLLKSIFVIQIYATIITAFTMAIGQFRPEYPAEMVMLLSVVLIFSVLGFMGVEEFYE